MSSHSVLVDRELRPLASKIQCVALATKIRVSISALMQEQEPLQDTGTTADEIVSSEHCSQPNSNPSQNPNPNPSPKQKPAMLLDIEREAIDFAQSLIAEPSENQPDKLSKLERDALRYAKNLLMKFGE